MKQTAFTLLTPIKAGEVSDLRRLLDEIGDDIKDNAHLRLANFEDLHYASLFVVAEGVAEPCLVFEGNVDGHRGTFLEHLLETAGEAVDKIYRHCVGYPSAGAADRVAVHRYLKAHDIGANTFFVAWPGRTVGDVRREQQLHAHIQEFLDKGGAGLRRQTPEAVRRSIAASLPADLQWARRPQPTPFLVEHGQKLLYLLLLPPALTLAGLLKTALGRSSTRRKVLLARVMLASVVGLVARAAQQLRSEEAKDERQDRQRVPDWQGVYARWVESEDLSGIVDREDRQVQNHMVSVTRVKQGWYRLTLLRVVLGLVNLIARLTANKGSLGGISSIHFARWVITPDGKHLLFLSNFDGSWESYLNDFIDLAAQGLTAVWTNTDNAVGFPRTRWLVSQGARDEARFKAYARFSMVPTNVWYSAYPDISVANIANNMGIRDGLLATTNLAATEAWLRRL